MAYVTYQSHAKPWRTTCLFLLASVSFHGLVLGVMVLVVNAQLFGVGTFRSRDTEVFSVSWFPTQGEGAEGNLDTVLAESESTAAFHVSDTAVSRSVTSAPLLLTIEQTDPQAVFNSPVVASTMMESQSLMTDESSLKLTAKHLEMASSVPSKGETDAAESSSASGTQDESATETEVTRDGENQNSDQHIENAPTNHGGEGRGVASAAGGRQTQFFGIPASSRRVVYVIDASESMRQHHAMELARRKLWESLQQLRPESQFQIVFFNLTTHTLGRPRDHGKLLPATSVNLRAAKQFATGIQPDSGTDRLAAILLALSYKPDTVFVLTDADAPELDAQELWDIHRRNSSKATIHVVEFGIHADLSRDSFLKRLARQNGGQHRYHDLARGE